MKKTFVGLGLLFCYSALAVQLDFENGNYGERLPYNYGGNLNLISDRPNLRIAKRPNGDVRIQDLDNNLVHALNVNATGSQPVSKEYLQFLKSRNQNSAVLSDMLMTLSIDNLQQKETTSTAQEISYDLVADFRMPSVFGNLATVMVFSGSVRSEVCTAASIVNTQFIYTARCLKVTAAYRSKVTSLNTSFGGIYDQVIGLMADFFIRIYTSSMNNEKTYIPIRKM